MRRSAAAGFSACCRVRTAAGRVACGVLLAAGLTWGAAVAQDAEPLNLEADSIRYDNNTGNSLYRGNVVISRAGMRLTGDEVEVFSENGEFLRIVARARPGTFRNRSADGNVDARADTIEYDIKRRTITFTGNAVVDDGEKMLQGERIIYDLGRKVVSATKSKGRVRLTINPAGSP